MTTLVSCLGLACLGRLGVMRGLLDHSDYQKSPLLAIQWLLTHVQPPQLIPLLKWRNTSWYRQIQPAGNRASRPKPTQSIQDLHSHAGLHDSAPWQCAMPFFPHAERMCFHLHRFIHMNGTRQQMLLLHIA